MTALYSATTILSLTISLTLTACTSRTTGNSYSEKVSSETIQQPNSTNNLGTQKDDLTKIYSQAIGDYIRLVNKEYKLTFDTLFFGKHVYGQPDDFPDIELPASIEKTNIKLISPEQGEKNQKKRKSLFYINLIGRVNADNADFIFVTFSNGFSHQFDCFISYEYDINKHDFDIENTRFENYRYKTK